MTANRSGVESHKRSPQRKQLAQCKPGLPRPRQLSVCQRFKIEEYSRRIIATLPQRATGALSRRRVRGLIRVKSVQGSWVVVWQRADSSRSVKGWLRRPSISRRRWRPWKLSEARQGRSSSSAHGWARSRRARRRTIDRSAGPGLPGRMTPDDAPGAAYG